MVPDWLNLFALATGRATFRRILVWVAIVTVYAAAVAAIDAVRGGDLVRITPLIHTFLGLVLGLLLVFRTNTAYDRWWEGRKLWGQLVNESRNFAIKIQTCVDADPREKVQVSRRLAAFAFALKDHLRGGAKLRSLPTFEAVTFQTPIDEPGHVPAFVAAAIYERIEHWRRADQLGGFELLFLDRHAAALMDVCGGCERILKTPIAGSYRTFIRQSIGIYLLTLPWGVVDSAQFWTVPLTAIVAYFMIGVEVLAEDAEEPFGFDEDDLDLDGICATIDRSIRQIVPG